MASELEALATESAEVERRIAAANAERERWQAEAESARAAIGERETQSAHARQALPAAEGAAQNAASGVRAAQAELAAAEQAQSIVETRETHALKLLSQIEARKNRLKQENMALVFPDSGKLAAIENERAARTTRLATLEQAQRAADTRLPSLEEERRSAIERVQEATRELASLEAALQALEAQQSHLDSDSNLNDWLRTHGLERAERLWQAIQVEAGWDEAVEAALGVRLNAARLTESAELKRLVRDAPPANFAVFIERAVLEPAASQSRLEPLASVVTSSRTGVAAYLREALANIFILPDGEDGLALAPVLAPGQLLAAKSGHLFSPQGVVFHGPQSQLHGVLQRKREIEELRTRIPARALAKGDVEADLKRLEHALKGGQDEARGLREEVSHTRQEAHDLEVEHLKLAQSSQQSEQRRAAIRGELSALEEDEGRERLEMQEAQHALEMGAQLIEAIVQRLAALESRETDAKRDLESARSAISASERALSEAHFQERSYREKVASQGHLTVSLGERLQALSASRSKLTAELEKLEEGRVRERLQRALEVKSEREKILSDARAGLEHLTQELRALEEGRLTVEQSLAPLRERITELRLKEQEAATHAEQYAQQLREAGARREELAEQIEKRVRSSSLQNEINRLNEEIAVLGLVNLAALSELADARSRKDFLDAQAADLTQAVATLEAAIKRIDRETRELLQETFEAVNANFQEMFPALFGGGHASLRLTGEEILDAGLQVFAQPPGKKNQSIQLLSGGEKALTAIALVFALFKLNPAPFCLLDEVDAPLDDPNTERFCELVRQMSAQTQFLFITHNKITMELASQLVGVTMPEPGVSRVVEVDIETAMELARKQAA
ncbi:MAG TPA: chromosome segregation protein SMC, partial [Usitatibacter sp.]|nr:chromosome segregation protein SMC [Usitatibacter sp.]